MIQDDNNSAQLPYYNAGKWNWKAFLISALQGFASGGIVGAACGAASYAIDQLKPPVLPAGEMELITTWYRNEFLPYFSTLVDEGNNILEHNFGIQSLPQLNILQNKLCLIQNFYSNNNTDVSISAEGINFRRSLVLPYCNAVTNLLQEKATTLSAISATAIFDSASFVVPILPQPQSGTFSCANYVLKGTITPTKTLVTATPQNTSKKDSNLSWLWLTLTVGTVVLLWPKNADENINSRKR
jgi:hypothetical protein